jgi:hypothetical protein
MKNSGRAMKRRGFLMENSGRTMKRREFFMEWRDLSMKKFGRHMKRAALSMKKTGRAITRLERFMAWPRGATTTTVPAATARARGRRLLLRAALASRSIRGRTMPCTRS